MSAMTGLYNGIWCLLPPGPTSGGDCGLRVVLHEAQDLPPRVLAGFLVLVESPVEEGVRGAVVGDHPVRHARLGQLAVELLELLLWREVSATHQQQERRPHLRDDVAYPRGNAIEADAAGEAVACGRLPPGLSASEAEPHCEHGAHVAHLARTQEFDGRPGVRRDALRRCPLNVRPVLEALLARTVARRAAEVVDGHGVDAGFRETLGELLVEAV